MIRLLRRSFVLTALLLLPPTTAVDPDDIVLNEYQYCIKYFGYVQLDVELPDSVPDYNYNGTQLCPASFELYPGISGATLEICPPYSSDQDGMALSASLIFQPMDGQLDGPLDYLELTPTLITNGSVPPAHFEGNGIPATLAKDIHESDPLIPVWTINGTQAALTDYPDITDDNQGVYISCDYPGSNIYCGGYEDIHDAVTGGCWRSQSIPFNMQTAMNFTFRFDMNEATVEIWVESEYVTYLGNRTGANTQAYLKFSGGKQLPSVVDYDFWENSQSDYEVESGYMEERKDMKLEEDEAGMPILVNRTDSGEWYDSANGTFSTQKANGADKRLAELEWVHVLFLLGTILLSAISGQFVF